jgi:large subunit ribosomal protein L18e
LLGSGDISGKPIVAAYSFSTGARDKIEAAGGKVLSLGELMEQNPSGTGVFILG